jgi:hypothetical protein
LGVKAGFSEIKEAFFGGKEGFLMAGSATSRLE